MSRRPPKSTLPDPLLPSTPLFRSLFIGQNLLERLAVSQQPSQPAAPLAGVLIPGLGPGQPRREPVQAVVQLQGERGGKIRSEEHTSELQSLMRISYAVFCLKKKTNNN